MAERTLEDRLMVPPPPGETPFRDRGPNDLGRGYDPEGAIRHISGLPQEEQLVALRGLAQVNPALFREVARRIGLTQQGADEALGSRASYVGRMF